VVAALGGKAPGDLIRVALEPDRGTRSIVVPDDVRAALDEAGIAQAFLALGHSHQREYVSWIDEAKRPETRARRIAQAVERIRAAT
jgi:uncharacterized protein YdeI (YjbR/CyaY-like superfamily)